MHQALINNPENLIIQRSGHGIKLINTAGDLHSGNHLPLNKIFDMPLYVYFLDSDSVLQSANQFELNILNILSLKDLAGLTPRDVAIKETADYCINHDLDVLSTRKMIIKEASFTRLDEIAFPMITFKFPWYSQDNHLIGVFGISLMINKEHGTSLSESMSLLTQTGLLNTTQDQLLPGLAYGDIYFTQREKEILFHLVRGKSAKTIACIFGRSRRTIEQHIENMKFKTNSHSKAELIDKITQE